MFEVGKYYQAANGAKVLCVHRFECGSLLFASEHPSISWMTNHDGYFEDSEGRGYSIGGEWREPAKVMVELYRHNTSNCILSKTPYEASLGPRDAWELIARAEITEGEGL